MRLVRRLLAAQTQRTDTDTRNALNKPSVTAGRSRQQALRDGEEVSGEWDISESLSAHAEILEQADLDYVDHLMPTVHRLGRHAP